MSRPSILLLLTLALALPALAQQPEPLQSEGADAAVETRGLKDALNRRKAKQLDKKIQNTEAAADAKRAKLRRVQAKLDAFANAQTVNANTVDLVGVKFTVADVRVGDRVMGANSARKLRGRLLKRRARLQRSVEDYTEKLDGGPVAYGRNGLPRRGLRGELEDLQGELDGPFLQPVNPRPRPNEIIGAAPRVGERLGGHRVRKRLGGGANGEVFLAEGENGEFSVIKHSRPRTPNTGDPNEDIQIEGMTADLQSARRKAGLTDRLTPEEILRATNAHEVEMQNLAAQSGNPAFIPARLLSGNRIQMPYAGATGDQVMRALTLRLARGEITPEVFRAANQRIARQMLEATASLDDSGIVHRDLKLANMALEADGSLKVIDFGSAKRKGDDDRELAIRTGVGTFGFRTDLLAPPEAVRADDLANFLSTNRGDPRYVTTHRTDVYCVGKAAGLVELTNGADAGTQTMIRNALRRPGGGRSLSEELAQDDVDARPTARQALRRRDLWEDFPQATEDAALAELQRAAGLLVTAQKRVPPPRPTNPPPPIVAPAPPQVAPVQGGPPGQ